MIPCIATVYGKCFTYKTDLTCKTRSVRFKPLRAKQGRVKTNQEKFVFLLITLCCDNDIIFIITVTELLIMIKLRCDWKDACCGEYTEAAVTLHAHAYVHVLLCVLVGAYQRLNSLRTLPSCVCVMCLGWDELGLGVGGCGGDM